MKTETPGICYVFISNLSNSLFSCREVTSVLVANKTYEKCYFDVHEIKLEIKVSQQCKLFREC